MRKSYLLTKACPNKIFFQTVKRIDGVIAKIIGYPLHNGYDLYAVVESDGIKKFKLWIYSAEMEMLENEAAFLKLLWKNDNELQINIPSKRVEITVFVNEAKATIREFKKYITPPFEMSRTRSFPTTIGNDLQ